MALSQVGACMFCSNFLYCLIVIVCFWSLLTGCTHSHSGYCSECKLNLEPNCSLEEHQRSRSHINRLLQLGIEIPISSVSHAEETQLPEGGIFHYTR